MKGFCPKGVLSHRGFVPEGFCPRGFCPRGVLSYTRPSCTSHLFNFNPTKFKIHHPLLGQLGLCLGWKGHEFVGGRGREDGGERVGRGRREGGGDVGERGRMREREGGWGKREGGGRGGMTVIHIVIGMFTSNPMIPQYLNNNLT